MLNLITIPAATTTLAQMADFSSGMFNELFVDILPVVGILIGCMIVAFFAGGFTSAVSWLISGRGQGYTYQDWKSNIKADPHNKHGWR